MNTCAFILGEREGLHGQEDTGQVSEICYDVLCPHQEKDLWKMESENIIGWNVKNGDLGGKGSTQLVCEQKLCQPNNTCIVITGTGQRLITVHCLMSFRNCSISNQANILLLWITFKDILPSGHTLLWKQFQLVPAYTSTFHSCQDLTLDWIGIDLTKPWPALYSAVSGAKSEWFNHSSSGESSDNQKCHIPQDLDLTLIGIEILGLISSAFD